EDVCKPQRKFCGRHRMKCTALHIIRIWLRYPGERSLNAQTTEEASICRSWNKAIARSEEQLLASSFQLSDIGYWLLAFDPKEAGQYLAGFAFDDVGEGGGVERGLGTDVDGAGSFVAGPADEVGRRVDRAG